MGSRPLPAQLLGFLGLLLALGQDLGVLGSALTVLLPLAPLECQPVPLALQHGGRHQPLDLGGLGSRLLNFLALLNWQRPLDDVLPDVVLLAQVEQLPQVRGTLGAQTTGDGVGGKPRDLGLAGLKKVV